MAGMEEMAVPVEAVARGERAETDWEGQVAPEEVPGQICRAERRVSAELEVMLAQAGLVKEAQSTTLAI